MKKHTPKYVYLQINIEGLLKNPDDLNKWSSKWFLDNELSFDELNVVKIVDNRLSKYACVYCNGGEETTAFNMLIDAVNNYLASIEHKIDVARCKLNKEKVTCV